MPVVNVNLMLDDATYRGVMDGALELCGMVKDQKHRVRKHLPTVFDSAKEGAAKAIDIVRNHKKELIIVGGLVIVGGAVVGTVSYFTQKEKRIAKSNLVSLFRYILTQQRTAHLQLIFLMLLFLISIPLLDSIKVKMFRSIYQPKILLLY